MRKWTIVKFLQKCLHWFRKPLLYPFELRERASRKNTPANANGKPMPLRGMTNS
jgi:hypothetical protein